ncbi:micrococcal nuclease [Microdochium nivale]|nr:micrococcal nuclease [Microdochium nivale]
MAYTLLLGRFVIRYADLPNQGPEPDGDTITFKPDDQDALRALPHAGGRPPKFSGRGNIGIRLEAIDALETHFPKGPMWHQEKEGGGKARDELLHRLGFRDVVFRGHKVSSANHDDLPGYVLANSIDPNGRVIGFIFAGGAVLDDADFAPPGGHGDSVMLDEELTDRSVNGSLLADGLVYPAFYGTLPPPLRTHLAARSRAARHNKLGLWPRSTADPDSPAEGLSRQTIQGLVIWPKLFRRTVAYLKEGNTDFDGFKAWLRKQARGGDDDKILILEKGAGEGGGGRLANLHDVVAASGTSLQLQVWPNEFVIEPK